MLNKMFLQKLGFIPKDNANGVFYKRYQSAGNYCIEIDIGKERFNFGNKIKFESGTTQNFSQEENWVVLECVDRLIKKGYRPEDITLEKKWKTGHGTSGRLDILVEKNKKAYLMIECKMYGSEFDKEFKKIQKDGGQLFTYFQQDNKAEYLMLYTSEFDGKEINFKNEIIKIEEHYREAGNIKDFFDRWNKLTKQNGIFEDWVNAYEFQSKAFTKQDLKPLTQEYGDSLFNKFESILRKHTVSDGPNAFNKIFNLFLAKIFDEKKRETDELDFQWKENKDDNVNFQIRLINLYKEGMFEFLKKEIEGIKDSDFSYTTAEELEAKKKKWLKFNKIFDIKEVFDDESFEDNARVLKELVELLSKYQIRYPRKQQHLSDFFERLLTTGLKQRAGQFFTPPPIARFIIKSLPLKEIITKKLSERETPELPVFIDYAAGSGHFLTESMEETQKIIDEIDTKNFYPDVISQVEVWKKRKFDWASKYTYGIEKDYRLVKVAKVGCYFYGDGLAQVIYGDGLDSFFESKSYRGFLKQEKQNKDNPKFDFLISNPPYSVQRFRADIKNKSPKESFELYESFTDNSKEIECLFIERMKHLLKEDVGCAGIILPSSILSNAGIYTKAREVLLKYFEIIAIVELGSGTFMATGTNTVILFLCRRENYEWEKVKSSVEIFFQNHRDITAGGVENIFSKYVKQAWGTVSFDDYISFCQNKPNDKIKNHDIYKAYDKKIKSKNDEEKQEKILQIEKEKLLYFILGFNQKVVVVKSGNKKEEKAFLGYEFSNRRGYEGIHAMQRSKSIDECTKMYDSENLDNRERASFYIHKAFLGEADLKINKSIEKNVSYANLVDMMNFDRVDFEKIISLTLKKILKVENRWEVVKIEDIKKEIINGSTPSKQDSSYWNKDEIKWATIPDFNDDFLYLNKVAQFTTQKALDDTLLKIVPAGSVLLSCTATLGKVAINKVELTTNQQINAIVCNNKIIPEYLAIYLKTQKENFENLTSNLGVKHINLAMLNDFKIPLPPKEMQEKIVRETEKLRDKEGEIFKQVKWMKREIVKKMDSTNALQEVIGKFVDTQYGYTANAEEEGNIRYLRITDISENGEIKDANKKFINVDDMILKQFSLSENDILIARSGSVGKAVIYKNKYGAMVFASYLVRLKVLDSKLLIPEFLFYFTKTKSYWEQVEELTTKGNQPNLNAEKMKLIKIPFPNLSEQKKIVAQIKKIENQILKLNEELREIKNQQTEVLKKYLY